MIVVFAAPEGPTVRMPSMLLPPGVQTEKVVLKGELLQLECIPEGLCVKVLLLHPQKLLCCLSDDRLLVVVPIQKLPG